MNGQSRKRMDKRYIEAEAKLQKGSVIPGMRWKRRPRAAKREVNRPGLRNGLPSHGMINLLNLSEIGS